MEMQGRVHDDDSIINQPEIVIPDEEEDRITQLPNEILHQILSLIPSKTATTTSILSNRWMDLWKSSWAYTTTLNFGWEFTTTIKTLSLVSCAIDQILQLHKIDTIDIFRLYFHPRGEFLVHIQQWIEFAVGKGVRELDLDFEQCYDPLILAIHRRHKTLDFSVYELPPCLFSCDSLTILKLANCKFKLPLGFRGFSSLKTLYLSNVRITHDTLDGMLLNCPMLEDLALMDLRHSMTMEFSATDLKIKSLTLAGCPDVSDLGSLFSKLAHLQILAICYFKIQDFSELGNENAPGNLIDLQLEVGDNYGLPGTYALFTNWNFPYLKKLTIEWIPHRFQMSDEMVQPSGCVFCCLKTIMINGFLGREKQMQMVKFLLQKAVVLETMVLVIPKEAINRSLRNDSISQAKPIMTVTDLMVLPKEFLLLGNDSISQAKSSVAVLRLLHEQLLLLPKVSTNAQFVLKEHTKDDDSILATHQRYWHSPPTWL
ncbi:hypothetical protein AAC387_Pa04g1676 [Persea americana]